MIITAYKCEHDGKIFEDKDKYKKHLQKLAKERRVERKIQNAKTSEQQFWEDNFWNRVRSPAQLQYALLIHAERLGLKGLAQYWFAGYRKRPEGPPLIKKFNEFRLRYSDSVSNTHSCPIGGVQNWNQAHNRHKGLNLPEGYPGFHGRIDYDVEWFSEWSSSYPGGSDMWKETRIHTHTGGGGGYKPYDTKDKKGKGLQNFGYDITIYFDDWPAMKESYEHAKVFAALKNDNSNIVDFMNQMFPAEGY